MRVILMVLDSVGAGALPDAYLYGDEGSNTLINIKNKVKDMNLKNLIDMGISNINGLDKLSDIEILDPKGSFGRCTEKSKGKDTTVGHWEIAGLITEKMLPTYPQGFPKALIKEFESKVSRNVIGNCVASGTEIIDRLGDLHCKTGDLIVYTSADSVFQIAAHEEVVKLDELYDICKIARGMLQGEHGVSRVIARPFVGSRGNYTRTKNRKDFSLLPSKDTILDYIKNSSKEVVAVGKISDIFANKGITRTIHTSSNMDGILKTINIMDSVGEGIIFTNLVDFDMLYGHRNDFVGYSNALVEFDSMLDQIKSNLRKDDILIITADHGCDPTTKSTDHSREYIPVLIYGYNVKKGVDIGTRESFSDIGATILDYLNIKGDIEGISFLDEIIKNKE